MSIHNFLTLALILFAAMIVPGPGVMAVVGRSLMPGWRRNLAFIGGMVLGDLTWPTLTLPGLAGLSGRFTAGFAVLKIAGGFYLIYLGLRACFAPAARRDTPQHPCNSAFEAYLLALSNPKAILFFIWRSCRWWSS